MSGGGDEAAAIAAAAAAAAAATVSAAPAAVMDPATGAITVPKEEAAALAAADLGTGAGAEETALPVRKVKNHTIYPVANFKFGEKAAKMEKDATIAVKMQRMKQKYEVEGPRRNVEAVLIVHQYNHPHILLLQTGSYFKLPGGRLRPGEEELVGLKRKLESKLSPESDSLKVDWEIGDCVGCFYRPNFETAVYPYLPAHITRPKEVKRLFIVNLPPSCYFAVPSNLKLLAVPLFELYDNVQRYGPVIAGLPLMLSQFQFVKA